MSELKCPFCNQELREDIGYDGDYSCPNCSEPYFGSPELWQELIRTRKALDVAVDVLKEIDETRSYSKEPLQAINNRILNAGICFCWTLPDNIHRALWKINNIDKGE